MKRQRSLRGATCPKIIEFSLRQVLNKKQVLVLKKQLFFSSIDSSSTKKTFHLLLFCFKHRKSTIVRMSATDYKRKYVSLYFTLQPVYKFPLTYYNNFSKLVFFVLCLLQTLLIFRQLIKNENVNQVRNSQIFKSACPQLSRQFNFSFYS